MNTRPATAILAEIRDGQLVVELSDAIKAAVAAVGEYGKAATISLDLTIEPLRKGMENLVEAPITITGEVTSKLPKQKVEATLFFIANDGNPTRNPGERQPSLGLTVAGVANSKT